MMRHSGAVVHVLSVIGASSSVLASRTWVRGYRLSMDLTMTAPTPADWAPVDACTLPTAEQPVRLVEFDDLFATSLRAVERPPGTTTRARLVLAGDDGLRDRVQRLADAETACCSFFTFTVTPLGGAAGDDERTTVALDIEVPAARADILAALADRAARVRGAAA